MRIPYLEAPERDISESTRRILHNIGAKADRLDEPTLRELLMLDSIFRYDYETRGPIYQYCISETDIEPGLYNMASLVEPEDKDVILESSGGLYHPSSVDFVSELSRRQLQEYLRVLDHFHFRETIAR